MVSSINGTNHLNPASLTNAGNLRDPGPLADPSTFDVLAQNGGDMGAIHRDQQTRSGAIGGLVSWLSSGSRALLGASNNHAATRDLEALSPAIRSELEPFRGTGGPEGVLVEMRIRRQDEHDDSVTFHYQDMRIVGSGESPRQV